MYQVDSSTIEYDKIKLKFAYAGGAPVPVELIRDFREKFGAQVVDGYGLTEAAGVTTTSAGAPIKPGSIGQAFFEQETEIMDADNNILPYGTVGEICIKGEAVVLGYLNQPEATAETIKDGWLHTGDLGYMDEQGYFYYSGRLKEMINRGGENIYPREIELPLEGHPKIKEVAVVGQPDPALGERCKACVILKEPGTMTAEEVKDYLRDKIAKYKLPEFVEFYDDFPRTGNGKVIKKELRQPQA
jgi:long-chain acyl-CoA synthetase